MTRPNYLWSCRQCQRGKILKHDWSNYVIWRCPLSKHFNLNTSFLSLFNFYDFVQSFNCWTTKPIISPRNDKNKNQVRIKRADISSRKWESPRSNLGPLYLRLGVSNFLISIYEIGFFFSLTVSGSLLSGENYIEIKFKLVHKSHKQNALPIVFSHTKICDYNDVL
jgi:hypothetical protein